LCHEWLQATANQQKESGNNLFFHGII